MTEEKKFSWEEFLYTPATYSEDEYNRMVDKWIAERNKHIGESYRPPVGTYPPDPRYTEVQSHEWVTTDLIRRWCDAINDYKNPLFRSEDYAKKSIWGGIIAPFQLIDAIAPTWVGSTVGRPPGIWMYPAGSTCKFFQVIRPGDKIQVRDTYMGVVELCAGMHLKEKGYRLIKDVTRRTYINQREEIVAEAEAPVIGPAIRPGGKVTPADVFPARPLPKYAREYVDLIFRTCEDEKPWGEEKRYWEEVVEGEEIQPSVAELLNGIDTSAYMAMVGSAEAMAGAGWWERLRTLRAAGVSSLMMLDKMTSFPVRGIPQQNQERIARSSVEPGEVGRSLSYPGQAWGVLSHLVTNWMGDDGVCKSFSSQMRRVWYFDECCWSKGKVARKYIESDGHLVDLELHNETQDGIVFMTGTATVRLPWRGVERDEDQFRSKAQAPGAKLPEK